MNRTTNGMIKAQLERLAERTGLKLVADHNPVYGGSTLNVVINESGGEADLSYYRMPKQHFYTMLRAMNAVFDNMEMNRREKEVNV